MTCKFCGKAHTPYHDPEMVECAQRQVEAMAEKLRSESKEQVTIMAALLREHIDRALQNGELRFQKLEAAFKQFEGDKALENAAAVETLIREIGSSTHLPGDVKSAVDHARTLHRRISSSLEMECALKKQMREGFEERDTRYANLYREQRQLFGAIGEALNPGGGTAPVVVGAAIDDVKELRFELEEERKLRITGDELINRLQAELNAWKTAGSPQPSENLLFAQGKARLMELDVGTDFVPAHVPALVIEELDTGAQSFDGVWVSVCCVAPSRAAVENK